VTIPWLEEIVDQPGGDFPLVFDEGALRAPKSVQGEPLRATWSIPPFFRFFFFAFFSDLKDGVIPHYFAAFGPF